MFALVKKEQEDIKERLARGGPLQEVHDVNFNRGMYNAYEEVLNIDFQEETIE